jgi:hypothetical protein
VISGGLLARAVPGLVIGLAPALPVPLTLTLVAVHRAPGQRGEPAAGGRAVRDAAG